jgi:hypothetical protein
MSSSISTLLVRNLHDVFGKNDPARRRVAIAGTDFIIARDGRIAAVYLFFDKLS